MLAGVTPPATLWRGLVVSGRAAPWWDATRRTVPGQPSEGPPSSEPSPLPSRPLIPLIPNNPLNPSPSPTTSPKPSAPSLPTELPENFPNTIATGRLSLAGARRGGPDRAEVTQWLG